MQKHVMRFANDESGATAIEYGLIAALIAVGIIAAARGLGSQIGLTFNTLASTMQAA
jgi:pilus assembly protein Flp/PilA